MRQAYISQHLMDLRKAKVLVTRREGRFIYYRLGDERLLDLIQQAGEIAGIPETELASLQQNHMLSNCCCPKCLETIQVSDELPEDKINTASLFPAY